MIVKDDAMIVKDDVDKVQLAILIGKAAGVNVELTPAQAGYLLQQARRAGKLRLALDKMYLRGRQGMVDGMAELIKMVDEAILQDDQEMEEE